MSELGQFLKQKRLEKNISLEKLQEQTKIRKRYIEAIETGDYRVLPGQFYARAFIKSYAEAIGLNGEQILNEYAHELPEVPKAPVHPPPPEKRQRKRVKTRSPKVGKWLTRIVLYAFLFVIGFFIYYAYVQFSDQRNTVDPQLTPGIEGDHLVQEGDQDELEKNNSSDHHTVEHEADDEQAESDLPPDPEWIYLETSAGNHYYEYRNAETFVITIVAATDDVWYEMRNHQTNELIDSRKLIYSASEQETFDISDLEEVYIRFGNTIHLQLLINGEEVEVPKESGPQNVIIRFQPLVGES